MEKDKGKGREEVESDEWVMQPGMARGYEESDMSDLRKEYERDSLNEVSLQSRVGIIAEKSQLAQTEVLDRGISTNDSWEPRFCLETGFRMRLSSPLMEFQEMLRRASALVKGRDGHYTIDPHSSLLNTLRGASSLAEMHVAWTALQRRVALGLNYFDKYDKQYRAISSQDLPISPISTAPDLYDGFSDVSSQFGRVAFLHEKIPHHYEHLRNGLPLTRSEMMEALPVPSNLQKAFPEREREERPSTIFYSNEGRRIERSLPATTSRNSGPEFQLPEVEEVSTEQVKLGVSSSKKLETKDPEATESKIGKVADISSETPLPSRQQPVGLTSYASVPFPERTASSQTRTTLTATPTYMGPNLPFKKAEEFFLPPRSPITAYRVDIPGSNLPNPIQGMAAPTSYIRVDESASRAGFHRPISATAPQDPFQPAGWTGNPGIPLRREIYAEYTPAGPVPVGSMEQDIRAFGSTESRYRDAPPHMGSSAIPESSRRPRMPTVTKLRKKEIETGLIEEEMTHLVTLQGDHMSLRRLLMHRIPQILRLGVVRLVIIRADLQLDLQTLLILQVLQDRPVEEEEDGVARQEVIQGEDFQVCLDLLVEDGVALRCLQVIHL
ncbi:hypothetical protein B0H12DRAFT_1310279 [Mycena haematopus]|nr:hypothetical protein B0H12DRAFT_1310279 [Mycena haematopus]